MVIIIKKILFFLLLLFTFNITEIDSNSDKRLVYNTKDNYMKSSYKIYFKNITLDELEEKLKILDVEIISFIIDDKEYYARNYKIFEEKYLNNKTQEEVIYHTKYGIKIDGIKIICTINDLIILENITDMY